MVHIVTVLARNKLVYASIVIASDLEYTTVLIRQENKARYLMLFSEIMAKTIKDPLMLAKTKPMAAKLVFFEPPPAGSSSI
mmetsp:Transcript_61279/g.164600  ORF Transcript_61279/g.164600 Transcript_61279/m.164600 type:complete len:81 (+) Transcript_61279:192-434(+)